MIVVGGEGAALGATEEVDRVVPLFPVGIACARGPAAGASADSAGLLEMDFSMTFSAILSAIPYPGIQGTRGDRVRNESMGMVWTLQRVLTSGWSVQGLISSSLPLKSIIAREPHRPEVCTSSAIVLF